MMGSSSEVGIDKIQLKYLISPIYSWFGSGKWTRRISF
jgi:hypothetical protein